MDLLREVSMDIKRYTLPVFCFALVLLFATAAGAQNLNAIKARMLDRKPTIDTLKTRGIVGEGNDGYLHFRQKMRDAEKVVTAENNDRKTVYTAIARKEGVAVGIVGKRRAMQIARRAPAGVWLQKGDGTWYKK